MLRVSQRLDSYTWPMCILIHGRSQEPTFAVTDTCRCERTVCRLMLPLWSESKTAALTVAPYLKRLNLGHYRATHDQAELDEKPFKNGFPSMVIFSRQGCRLMANQLKLPLEERTRGIKQNGCFNFTLMGQSIKSLTPFFPKIPRQISLSYGYY